jgi:hypothetical protein
MQSAKTQLFLHSFGCNILILQPKTLYLHQIWLIMDNQKLIIGRNKEIKTFNKIVKSKKSEFVAV